jgi:intracellular sulfur oxidation DsrE/DsrF family protein
VRTAILVSRDPAWALDLAAAWAAAGDVVTLVLCDHAAVWARERRPESSALARAAQAGVTLRAHDEALALRGIATAALAEGVKPVSLDEIADLLVDGADKAVWL